MIYYLINDSERSADIKNNSLKIDNQLQQRTDQVSFEIFQGTKPSENQDVRIFRGDQIASAIGATLVLKGYFQRNIGIFFPGQKLHIRINDADEAIGSVDFSDDKIHTLYLVAGAGFRNLRVSYTVGYKTAETPEDLKMATIMLIAGIFNQRNMIGYDSQSVLGMNVAMSKEDYLFVKRVLIKYKSVNVL